MKKLIIVAFISLLSFAYASGAGELKIKPQKPASYDVITLKYQPDERFDPGEKLFAQIYAFDPNNAMPKAYEFELSYEDYVYSGKFTLPSETVFALIKLSDGEMFDANHRDFWDLLYYEKSGKPKRNANLKAGLTFYGNLPENFERNVNFDKALDYLRREIKYYRDNLQARIGLASLRLDLREITFEEYSETVESLLDRGFNRNNENAVRAVARALRSLNKKKEAEKLESQFIAKNPQSRLAEEKYLSDLAEAKSLDEFSDKIFEYFKKFSSSENRNRMFSALVSGYLQVGKLEEAIVALNKLNAPAAAYAQVAFTIVNDDNAAPDMSIDEKYDKALELMDKSVEMAREHSYKNKPRHISESEWERKLELEYATVLEKYGDILMSAGLYKEAYKSFGKAFEYYKDEAPQTLYENLTDLCEILEKYDKAYSVAKMAILSSKYNSALIKEFKKLHKMLMKSEEPEILAAELLAKAKLKRLKELSYHTRQIETSIPDFVDLKENSYKIEGKRKAYVVHLFSSWCGPCEKSLKAFDKFYKKNKDKNYFIAAVGVWETGDAVKKTSDFIEDLDLSVPVFTESSGKLARDIGITGLPATCFIDSEKKTQFIMKGFSFEERFAKDSKDRLDYLIER